MLYLYTAQFIVHIRRFGVIALQNVANRDCWLSILEGSTLGTVSHCVLEITRNHTIDVHREQEDPTQSFVFKKLVSMYAKLSKSSQHNMCTYIASVSLTEGEAHTKRVLPNYIRGVVVSHCPIFFLM